MHSRPSKDYLAFSVVLPIVLGVGCVPSNAVLMLAGNAGFSPSTAIDASYVVPILFVIALFCYLQTRIPRESWEGIQKERARRQTQKSQFDNH